MSKSKSLIKVKEHSRSITQGVAGNTVFELLRGGGPAVAAWVAAHLAFMEGWSWPLIILLGAGVFLILTIAAAIIITVKERRTPEQTPAAPTPARELPEQVIVKEPCPDSWLHTIAENDKKCIDRYVKVEGCEIVGHELLHRAPYVDFKFTILNASVYSVCVEESVKGDIYFHSQLLSKDIKMIENAARHCEHGDSKHFIVRQWLSSEEVACILNAPDDADAFRFSGLEITVKAGSPEQEVYPRKLDVYARRLSSKPLRELYRKLDIEIQRATFKGGGYFGGSGARHLLVNVYARITNPRPVRVRVQSVGLSGRVDGNDYSKDYVVYAETGEIYEGRIVGEDNTVHVQGQPLKNMNPPGGSLAAIEPGQTCEGWLQFIITGGIGFEEPPELPAELIVADASGEEHRARCLLKYGS